MDGSVELLPSEIDKASMANAGIAALVIAVAKELGCIALFQATNADDLTKR